jgi:hydrogenase maturation protease
MSRPIRVVGVGSPNGDDAVGWEVVRKLRERLDESSGVEIFEIEGGQRLLELLDGKGTLILIDAIVNGGERGTVNYFEWPDVRLEALSPGSTHTLRPAEALQLASALALLPQRVLVFGICVGLADVSIPRAGMSLPVADSIADVIQRIEVKLNLTEREGDRSSCVSPCIFGAGLGSDSTEV